MKLPIVLLLIAALFVVLRLAIPQLGKVAAGGVITNPDGERLADCPAAPACRCSQASRDAQRIAPIAVDGNADTLIADIAGQIDALPRTRIVTRDGRYLHATFSSRFWGFVDDVEILLDADGEHLQLRSASRLGREDFGANTDRIERLGKLIASLQETR